MNSYRALPMHRQPVTFDFRREPARRETSTARAPVAPRAIAWLIAGLIELLLVVAVVEAAIGVGYDAERGPIPAPVPVPGPSRAI